jgi:hypothetical protein
MDDGLRLLPSHNTEAAIGQPACSDRSIARRWVNRSAIVGVVKDAGAATFLSYNITLLSLSALVITDTELRLIAALAIIGLSSKPNAG